MATSPRRIAAARGRPHLRVIRGSARKRVTMPLAIVLVLAVFAVAGLQAYLGQEGFRMSNLEMELKQAEERYVLLRAEIAELSSPSSLERAASEIGMTTDPDPVFLPEPQGLPQPEAHAAPYGEKRLLGSLSSTGGG